eukprot:CAMPEP_0115000060 /NCGR_PEP_ID=MMETSP0216-20121206/16524_1 /TAXON_ID=223996 /ORGANISM="Protocruzia adherens, Strain Boccale" /LENGTH=98 /DNA_ID=CAMNT_0002365069 /DNA_START=304 /DNA_END=601 /DNA_ORIENTATION=+
MVKTRNQTLFPSDFNEPDEEDEDGELSLQALSRRAITVSAVAGFDKNSLTPTSMNSLISILSGSLPVWATKHVKGVIKCPWCLRRCARNWGPFMTGIE